MQEVPNTSVRSTGESAEDELRVVVAKKRGGIYSNSNLIESSEGDTWQP